MDFEATTERPPAAVTIEHDNDELKNKMESVSREAALDEFARLKDKTETSAKSQEFMNMVESAVIQSVKVHFVEHQQELEKEDEEIQMERIKSTGQAVAEGEWQKFKNSADSHKVELAEYADKALERSRELAWELYSKLRNEMAEENEISL